MKTIFSPLLLVALLMGPFALPAVADPHCQPCPYACSDLGLGKKDCSVLSESRGLCCLDLTQSGLKLAQEQERLLGSKNQATVAERCPSGFQESEQRCSNEERRRGCKDIRLPGGLGCVKR